MAFKTICVDHVGIACADLDAATKIYTEVLGLQVTNREEVKEQGVATVFIPCGETLLELLVDITENNDGPIGKYIAKNGPGIQHIALRVDDIKAAIADMEAAGVKMIDKVARNGAGNMKIAFVHPKSAGLLLELCQPAETYVD
jgi:methylmalonyl-CoA/ethylmalonyl-CoA epimerase